ncbi:MAG: 4,5-dioxygenase [Dehalococcoidia bacterium]|nr:4,5-dioxygenase [Dehalococcoidia bacterium]
MQDFEEFTGRLSEDFHFHVYFATETRGSALAIRERLKHGVDFEFDLPPVREKPVGPHRWPIWSIWVDRANFTAATLWTMRNHGSHSVLVHPETADSLADHTIHAMWLGIPLPLNLDMFSHE